MMHSMQSVVHAPLSHVRQQYCCLQEEHLSCMFAPAWSHPGRAAVGWGRHASLLLEGQSCCICGICYRLSGWAVTTSWQSKFQEICSCKGRKLLLFCSPHPAA